MPFQKAHVSIVRSIRQLSLVREWQRARKNDDVPQFSSFVPNERSGDAADLLTCDVISDGDGVIFRCQSAGKRVEQIYGERMASRLLHECLDARMAKSAAPIWNACIDQKMPVYSIIPLADRDECPVTVEQIFLPYTRDGGRADVMVSALHAWSTEGRFASDRLLRDITSVPLHWAVVVDTKMAAPAKPQQENPMDRNQVLLEDSDETEAKRGKHPK